MNREITIEELERLPGVRHVYDIRSREHFEKGTYPGAENLPFGDWDPREFAASANGSVYLLCHTGQLSTDLAGGGAE